MFVRPVFVVNNTNIGDIAWDVNKKMERAWRFFRSYTVAQGEAVPSIPVADERRTRLVLSRPCDAAQERMNAVQTGVTGATQKRIPSIRLG
jgi:hypothetical protein